MRVRLIIAGLTGVVVGLVALVFIQASQLRKARLEWEAALEPAPALVTGTNQRPLRLRLHSLPPIQLRTEVRTLDWRSIESDDYPTYIANLRATGCPEETIRDIILADVNKLFAARRHALSAPQPDWTYWRHPDEIGPDDKAAEAERLYQMQRDALDMERRLLIHTLLGESALQAELAEEIQEATEDRDLRFLPEEKRRAMAEATTQWRRAHALAAQATDEDEARRLHAAADQALAESVGRVLTPEERDAYELRSSPLAHDLRDRLRGFGATREEFEELFRIERQFEQERARLQEAQMTGSDPQALEKLEASEIEQQARVRELLGERRFADLERSGDPDYQTLFSLAQSHSMSPDLANQVWGMRRIVENQTSRIRENPFLTADQKTRALEAIRLETQAGIVDVLGEPLLNEYQQQGGDWIGQLTDPTDLGVTGQEMVPPPLPGLPVETAPSDGFLPVP
ncbi:MAG: hypothetical protein AB7O66_07500 [Limisphaerales bacterium]